MLPIDHLADGGADKRAHDSSEAAETRAAPFDIAEAGMAKKVGKRVHGDSEGAGANGEMRVGNADHIDHKGHSENGAAPAEQAESKADNSARQRAEAVLNGFQKHGAPFAARSGGLGSVWSKSVQGDDTVLRIYRITAAGRPTVKR